MPEVLRVDVGDEVRALGRPDPVLDPAMAAVVEAEVARAHERGRREGEQAGREAAEAAARRGAEAVVAALGGLHEEVRAQRETACAADLEVVARLVAEVVGRTPPDDATVVLDRVRETVDALDDDPLEVRLHPDDHAVLADGLADPRLQLVADPTLAPGQARVVGAWGGAELTREALLTAALAACAEGEV